MAPRRRRARRLDPRVIERIHELAALRLSSPRILAELERDAELATHAPHLRTVQKVAKELTAQPEEAWRVIDADPGQARLVLPVLAILDARGLVSSLTVPMAHWIARVGTAAPWLDPLDRFRFAVRYWSATVRETPTGDLDADLARTWRDGPVGAQSDGAVQVGLERDLRSR